jgi:hypothetical protein
MQNDICVPKFDLLTNAKIKTQLQIFMELRFLIAFCQLPIT